jgi:hypothetical protein
MRKPYTKSTTPPPPPSDQLLMFEVPPCPEPLTLSPSEVLAKVSATLAETGASAMNGAGLSGTQFASLMSADHVYLSGRMLRAQSAASTAQTFGRLCDALPTLGVIDLSGNCLIQSGYYPKIVSGFTLSDILLPPEEVGARYFLSEKSILGLMKGQQTPQLLELSPEAGTAKGGTQA